LFEYCKSLPQNMIDLIKAANARHIPKKGSRYRLPFLRLMLTYPAYLFTVGILRISKGQGSVNKMC
jgi:hypothetical protein